MIVRPLDIPAEGRELDFNLDQKIVTDRVDLARHVAKKGSILPPEYKFPSSPEVKVKVIKESASVLINGEFNYEFTTSCARCNCDVTREVNSPVRMVLKPKKETDNADEHEDLCLGYYNGEEFNCAEIVEEALILSLPQLVYCASDCRGLCLSCGVNLNEQTCTCSQNQHGDERLSILKSIKIQ